MKNVRIKAKGLVIGVSLFHLFTFSLLVNAQQRSWTADNGNGTFTNPLFYDEFSDPDILRVGDDYYLAGTTMHTVPGLVILHSNYHHIDVLRGSLQDDVADVAAHDVALQPQRVGLLTDAMQKWGVDEGQRVSLPCSLAEIVVFLYGVLDGHLTF